MTSRSTRHRIGIDLGGSKIGGIVLAPDGTVLAERRVPTPAGSYDGTLDAIAGLVGTLEQVVDDRAHRASVGIGTPGAISPATGRIKNANSTWLNGKAFDCDIADRRTARCGSRTMRTALRSRRHTTVLPPGALASSA